jgi:hypothetical protein
LFGWIRIRIQEDLYDPPPPQNEENSSFEVLDVLFEGGRLFMFLYEGLGINKLQFLSKKKNLAVNFFQFYPGSGLALTKKCWIRIRNETNADPQHW